ncbi:MAG: hypothetical protein ACM31N_10640 [Deltaproteobacteria bacterium]
METERREDPVRKAIVFGAALLLLVGVFLGWQSTHRPAALAASTFSQIFIHGTPVCVFTFDGNIMARVGECPDATDEDGAGSAEKAPFRGRPGMELPPGHPPVDRDMFPDDKRTVHI